MAITRDSINNVQVCTVIGSTRFESMMINKARLLQSMNYLSLMTFIGKEPTYACTENQLMREGYKRLHLSDFALCINHDGYIGDNTAREIDYMTMVERKPVYFECDKISEKMLKRLNFYWVDMNHNCHTWNSLLEDMEVKFVVVRNTPVISKDIERMMSKSDIDHMSWIISNLLMNQLGENSRAVVLREDSRVFEDKIRFSRIYTDNYPYNQDDRPEDED